MRDRDFSQIPESRRRFVKKLYNAIENASTTEICNFVFSIVSLIGVISFSEIGLSSPLAQCYYILSIAACTREPNTPSPLDREQMLALLEQIANDVGASAFGRYQFKLDRHNGIRKVIGPWLIKRSLSKKMMTTEQFVDALTGIFQRCNHDLKLSTGINISDVLEICKYIHNKLIERASSFIDAYKRLHEAHQKWADQIDDDELEEVIKKTNIPNVFFSDSEQKHFADLWNAYGKSQEIVNRILRSEIILAFPESGKHFCDLFSINRKSMDQALDISDESAAEPFPLVSDGKAFFVLCANSLYNGVLLRLTNIAKENFHERFQISRNKFTEDRCYTLLDQTFKNITLLKSVYTSDSSRGEHDIIIVYNNSLVVIEVKSAAVPKMQISERATYDRLVKNFSGESGVWGGDKQANNFLEYALQTGKTHFYDKKGNVLYTFEKLSSTQSYKIIITYDEFGSLTTDLTTLSPYSSTEQLPWAASLWDFEAFLEAMKMRGFNFDKFIEFLATRQKLHGSIISSDELAICEYFIRMGRLPEKRDGAKLMLEDTSLFDEIYKSKIAGEEFSFNTQYPESNFIDLREFLKASNGNQKKHKVGRNSLCPCGSGIKHKHCHGRKI